MARTGNGAGRRTAAGVPRRAAGVGLNPDFQIVRLVPDAFFQGERDGLDRAGERTRAETRGDGHT